MSHTLITVFHEMMFFKHWSLENPPKLLGMKFNLGGNGALSAPSGTLHIPLLVSVESKEWIAIKDIFTQSATFHSSRQRNTTSVTHCLSQQLRLRRNAWQ